MTQKYLYLLSLKSATNSQNHPQNIPKKKLKTLNPAIYELKTNFRSNQALGRQKSVCLKLVYPKYIHPNVKPKWV
jgi:hypothetical protein